MSVFLYLELIICRLMLLAAGIYSDTGRKYMACGLHPGHAVNLTSVQ